MEVQKYDLTEKLKEVDEEYSGHACVVGSSGLTGYPYNNSTRTQMFTSHLNQAVSVGGFVNGKEYRAEIPLVSFGEEKTVGDNSSGYFKMKGNAKVYRKVVKFKELLGEDDAYIYCLFYWNDQSNQYEVFEREPVKHLEEVYGYTYDNRVVDSFKEGDTIKDGTILRRSLSYDENMNYGYGVNLTTMYTLNQYTSEDAAVIDETASRKLSRTVSEVISWGWNRNDIPINLYGTKTEYHPLPFIGQKVNSVVVASRPQINDQLISDFAEVNLNQIRDGDRIVEYPGEAIVVDYDIFANEEIQDNDFNHDICELLRMQKDYWTEILQVCEDIIATGDRYSDRIDSLMNRALYFIENNEKRKWDNGSSIFGHLEFQIHVVEHKPLGVGDKFTARYGNKSVVAKVVPDYMMPFTADGRRVHVLSNLLAITNRTTAFVPHELHITHETGCAVREMKKHDTLEEKSDILFDIMDRLSHEEWEQEYPKYQLYSEEDKWDYVNDAEEHGIVIYMNMIDEDESIFYKLKRAEEELDYIKPDTLYIYKWGHVYRIDLPHYLGEMYFFPLRQTDRKGYSSRATGAVNQKGLPERSFKNKRYESAYSDTAIRFGEYEMPCFLIGMTPEEVTCLEAFYRTSPQASSDLTNAQFMNQRMMEFSPFYRSVTGEIFTVLTKHLGLQLGFGDEYDEIKPHDDVVVREHNLNGEIITCTNADFEYYLLRDNIKKALIAVHGPQTCHRLEHMVDDELKKQCIPGTKLPWEQYEIIDADDEPSAEFKDCRIGSDFTEADVEEYEKTIITIN